MSLCMVAEANTPTAGVPLRARLYRRRGVDRARSGIPSYMGDDPRVRCATWHTYGRAARDQYPIDIEFGNERDACFQDAGVCLDLQ